MEKKEETLRSILLSALSLGVSFPNKIADSMKDNKDDELYNTIVIISSPTIFCVIEQIIEALAIIDESWEPWKMKANEAKNTRDGILFLRDLCRHFENLHNGSYN